MSHPVLEVLAEMKETVESKAADYAEDDNVFSNFEFVAETVGIAVEQVFNVLIATKVARLMQLDASGKYPNHESVEDTLIDLANYSALRVAWKRGQAKPKTWLQKGTKVRVNGGSFDEGMILTVSRVLPGKDIYAIGPLGAEYWLADGSYEIVS